MKSKDGKMTKPDGEQRKQCTQSKESFGHSPKAWAK